MHNLTIKRFVEQFNFYFSFSYFACLKINKMDKFNECAMTI